MNRIANSEPTSIFAFIRRPPDKDVGLQATPNRRFAPAVGRYGWMWMMSGYKGDDTNLYRYPVNTRVDKHLLSAAMGPDDR